MTPLLSFLEQAAYFIVVLGLVVSFHELGHFLTAKAFGVKVEVFSLGFGRKIFGRKWGETEYRVSVVPLGGYVLMGGETGEEPPRPRDPRDFEAKPAGARFLIMAAGPVASALLAVLLMWIAFMGGIEVPSYVQQPPRIGSVDKDSSAEAAGLIPGDLVVDVSGRAVATWESFSEIVLTNPGQRLELLVERAGERVTVPVDVRAAGKHAIGSIGAAPCAGIVVRAVSAGSPAAGAGLLPGDVLARVAGDEPCSPSGLVGLVQAAAGGPLALEILREGRPVALSVTPRHDEAAGRWMIGIEPALATTTQRYGPVRALTESWTYNVDKARLVLEALGKLVTGRLSMRSMSGPLEMASMTEETADAGLVPLLSFVALITLNLAIFNLLPIPILDGGRMLLLLVEAVRGRDLERRTKEWILQAGLAMILVLTVVVLVFDAIKKLEG